MKRLLAILASVVVVAGAIVLFNNNRISANPSDSNGWFAAGSNPTEYLMELNEAGKHSGSKGAMIKYTASGKPSGFGTYMQMHKPGAWLGKKIKMTGWVKTEGVDGWCGMWCRVDGPSRGESLDFDNMQDRALKGTTGWTKCEIIMNVQKEATAIAYGVLLDGRGVAYFDDITFEVLGDAVPGESHKSSQIANSPANLNMEN